MFKVILEELLSYTDIKFEQLPNLAEKIIDIVPKNSILLIEGRVGAGKTTFVNEFCKKFNIYFSQSPTFAIHNTYKTENAKIDHFDLYRIDSDDELESAGFWDLIVGESDYKIIEWPEKCLSSITQIGYPVFLLKIVPNDNSHQYNLYRLI